MFHVAATQRGITSYFMLIVICLICSLTFGQIFPIIRLNFLHFQLNIYFIPFTLLSRASIGLLFSHDQIILIVSCTSYLNHLDLITSNLISNFVFSCRATHASQHPHLRYSHILHVLVLYCPTFYTIQQSQSYSYLINVFSFNGVLLSHKMLDAIFHFNHHALLLWVTTYLFISPSFWMIAPRYLN